jgi:hypothetical protein
MLVAHGAHIDRQGERVHRRQRGVDDPLLRLDHRGILLFESEAAHLRYLVLNILVERLVRRLHVVADRGEEVVRGLVGFRRQDVDGVIAGAGLGFLSDRADSGDRRKVEGAIQRMLVILSTRGGDCGHISLFIPGGSALVA